MIAGITYALVLFVHASAEPQIFASFNTAADCRAARTELANDLKQTEIVVACVPRNKVTVSDVSLQMQELLQVMQNIMEKEQAK